MTTASVSPPVSSTRSSTVPRSVRWEGETDGRLILLDQTRLPGELIELQCLTQEEVWQAIRELKVRGAPAIGIAA
ncbi:MAG: S-methyl-5-thioribose-1-phosphate isomerase, partial [Planctomycetota bacterium]